MDRISFIYGLTEPDGSEIRYVGKGIDPIGRYEDHLTDTQNGGDTHKCRWLRKVLKSGSMPGQVILQVVPFGLSGVFEMIWIHACRRKGHRLTNETIGGDGLRDPSPDTRSRMSASQKKRFEDPIQRNAISIAHKGKPLSPTHVEAIREANTGKKRSPEFCADISKRWLGRKRSPENCAKISARMKGRSSPMKGRKHSADSRAKISASRKGWIPSEEWRAKNSTSHKNRPWSPARWTAEEARKMKKLSEPGLAAAFTVK